MKAHHSQEIVASVAEPLTVLKHQSSPTEKQGWLYLFEEPVGS